MRDLARLLVEDHLAGDPGAEAEELARLLLPPGAGKVGMNAVAGSNVGPAAEPAADRSLDLSEVAVVDARDRRG